MGPSMRHRLCVLAGFAAALLSAPCLPAEPVDANTGAACPGAAAWQSAHADQSVAGMRRRDAARTPSRPDLLAELERRVAADQSARRAMLAHRGDDDAQRAVVHIDADNDAWLVDQFRKDGVAHAAQVGEFGLHLTWLLVQHADRQPQLQEIALKEFVHRYESGEFSADDLARLTDRVLLAQGKPQRFGTQFDWASGKFDPRHIDDAAGVDAQRGQLGLMPLSDYACVMNLALRRVVP